MAEALLKPPAVAAGSRIMVVSPASSAQAERITRGVEALRGLGYEPIVAEHAYGKHPPYFAGTVEERLSDLHRAFADPAVAAILCTRGGYGSNYLLDRLDLELIRTNPKPFFAYSDHTGTQTWLLDRLGLVSFHGPMVAADFSVPNGVHLESFTAAITGGLVQVGAEEGIRVLRRGRAQGILYGGCLSILTAALGTPYAPHTEGKLLFIEDIGAKPYQIDRMLRHLILAGKLGGVRGILFGEMLDCTSPGADPNLIEEVILHVLADYDIPIGIGLRSGHVSGGNVTLPFGIQAELDLSSDTPTLRTLEPAVSLNS